RAALLSGTHVSYAAHSSKHGKCYRFRYLGLPEFFHLFKEVDSRVDGSSADVRLGGRPRTQVADVVVQVPFYFNVESRKRDRAERKGKFFVAGFHQSPGRVPVRAGSIGIKIQHEVVDGGVHRVQTVSPDGDDSAVCSDAFYLIVKFFKVEPVQGLRNRDQIETVVRKGGGFGRRHVIPDIFDLRCLLDLFLADI